MTATDENLDQRRAKESVGSRDERGGTCLTGHTGSVVRTAGWRPPTAVAQHSYGARTVEAVR